MLSMLNGELRCVQFASAAPLSRPKPMYLHPSLTGLEFAFECGVDCTPANPLQNATEKTSKAR